jgi:hypothetical protein
MLTLSSRLIAQDIQRPILGLKIKLWEINRAGFFHGQKFLPPIVTTSVSFGGPFSLIFVLLDMVGILHLRPSCHELQGNRLIHIESDGGR